MTISVKASQSPQERIVNIWAMTQEGHNMPETIISIDQPKKDITIFGAEDDWVHGRLHLTSETAVNVLQTWRDHNDLVNNITLFVAKLLNNKGFVWSEMRTKCEISVKLQNSVYVLTYRKTGMPEAETVEVDDTTQHKLFKAINGILFD